MFHKKSCTLAIFVAAGLLGPITDAARAQGNDKGDRFAFWYEAWQPNTTINKLEAANVLIGVPADAVPEIHKSGRRALQYVTYYQSHFKTSFLIDRDDLANVGFQLNGRFLKSAFGGDDNYVLCANSAETRTRTLRYLEGTLKQGFDGYFVDNTFLQPAAQEVCTASHRHVTPDSQGGRAYVDLLAAIHEKMRQQNPLAILVSNPGNPTWADRIATGPPSLWDVSDYVLWESYGYTSYVGPKHDRWAQTIEQSFHYAAEPEKARKIMALSFPRNLSEARFAFGVARIFGFRWTANLGDSQQNNTADGGHFGAYLSDIPFELGDAVGALPDQGNPLLHRTFQRGEIFLNSGKSSQAVSVPKSSRVYAGDHVIETTGQQIMNLEPMTALIVITKQ